MDEVRKKHDQQRPKRERCRRQANFGEPNLFGTIDTYCVIEKFPTKMIE